MHRAVCSSLWRKGPGRARPGAMLSLSSPVAFCATKDGPCGSSSKISVHWLRLPAFISTHIMCDKAADSNFIRNITEAPAAKTQRGCYNNNFCKKKKNQLWWKRPQSHPVLVCLRSTLGWPWHCYDMSDMEEALLSHWPRADDVIADAVSRCRSGCSKNSGLCPPLLVSKRLNKKPKPAQEGCSVPFLITIRNSCGSTS